MSDPYADIAVGADPYAAVAVKAPPQAKRGWKDDVTGFMANVNRGLGIGDELHAAIVTAGDVADGNVHGISDLPRAFKANMARDRQAEDSFTATHPHVAALARGTGNALTLAAPVGPGAEAFATGGRVVNALRGATVAGLTGAGYAAVDRGTLQERAAAAASAAHDPLTLGLGAVGGVAAVPGKPKAQPPPTLEELTAQKNAAYKAVDDSGITIPAEDFHGLAGNMADKMDQEGFNAGLHPKAAAMMERIGKSAPEAGGVAPTLTQLDQLRQQIGRDVASSNDPGERRMGTIMRNAIDEHIASMDGTDDLIRGRELNTRISKLRSLDNLDEAAADRAAATGVGSNSGNALRQNIIRFQRETSNLTPDEAAATQTAVRGTGPQNALRAIGSLSPEGGTIRAATSIATGHMSGGAIPAVGFVAKRVADALAERNVQKLRDLIAIGGDAAAETARQLSAAAATDPAARELQAQLANDLSAQAGVQGTAQQQAGGQR